MTIAPLRGETVRFRERMIDGLLKVDREAVWYVSADSITATCPCCRAGLSVFFHSHAPRAEFRCELGCSEKAIGDALARWWS